MQVYYLQLLLLSQYNLKFQPKTCDSCHTLMQKPMSFNNIVIFFVKGNDYRIYFWYISKNEAINLLANTDLTEKSGTL